MNWRVQVERSSAAAAITCCGGVGTSADESIVTGVLLLVDVRRSNVGGVEVWPAAQRNNVDVDVDADTARVPFTEVETLSDGAQCSWVFSRTDRCVAVVLLPH